MDLDPNQPPGSKRMATTSDPVGSVTISGTPPVTLDGGPGNFGIGGGWMGRYGNMTGMLVVVGSFLTLFAFILMQYTTQASEARADRADAAKHMDAMNADAMERWRILEKYTEAQAGTERAVTSMAESVRSLQRDTQAAHKAMAEALGHLADRIDKIKVPQAPEHPKVSGNAQLEPPFSDGVDKP